MPDEKTIDPFKPQQPSIPGLEPSEAKTQLSPPASAGYSSSTPEEKAPRSPMLWVALSVLGLFFVLGGGFFYWMRSSSAKATSSVSSATAAVTADPAAPPKAAENLLQGPGPIATTADLPRAWSSKRFLFRDALTSEIGPAMVVRL